MHGIWLGAALAMAGALAMTGMGNGQADQSQTAPSTPAGMALTARLATARGGEVIHLQPGDYGRLRVPPRTFSPAIRIEAANARFSGIILNGADGVTITGGTVVGPGGKSYAVQADRVGHVRIENMTLSGSHRGIVLGRSSDVALVGNRLTGIISDGINVALSHRVTITGNRCSDFSPQPTTYDADGNRVSSADHPDCIQAWSRSSSPPTSDLVIENNVAEGKMQGIFLGNHVRDGVDDGGFDRVIVRNNHVRVSYTNGIALFDVRNGVVTGNDVSTLPGSVNGVRHTPVKSILRVRGTDTIVCGNIVAATPGSPASRPCKRD